MFLHTTRKIYPHYSPRFADKHLGNGECSRKGESTSSSSKGTLQKRKGESCFFVFCLFVYLESKNKQANLPNYMISTKKENKL